MLLQYDWPYNLIKLTQSWIDSKDERWFATSRDDDYVSHINIIWSQQLLQRFLLLVLRRFAIFMYNLASERTIVQRAWPATKPKDKYNTPNQLHRVFKLTYILYIHINIDIWAYHQSYPSQYMYIVIGQNVIMATAYKNEYRVGWRRWSRRNGECLPKLRRKKTLPQISFTLTFQHKIDWTTWLAIGEIKSKLNVGKEDAVASAEPTFHVI